MKKKICTFILVIISFFGINLKSYAGKANDCMYYARKQGLVQDVKLSSHLVYVDGYFWTHIPYDTKRQLVYCFAGYMEEKHQGAYVDVKDYNSGERYAHGGVTGSRIYE